MARQKFDENTSCLILCEGVDAYYFLIWMLDFYKRCGYRQFENVFVKDYGGISELSEKLQYYMNLEGFEYIRAIGIVRDAETNAQAAIQSIQSSLCNNQLPIPKECLQVAEGMINGKPIKTSYALFPGFDIKGKKWRNGTLENLCLDIMKEESLEILENADAFLNELEDKKKQKYPRKHKNQLHAVLTGQDKYVGLKIGEATKAGAFDLEHPNVVVYKDMILELLN